MRRRSASKFSGTVVGLDLSLRASAICALPCPWDHDMAAARVMHVGADLTKEATPRDRLDRMVTIADALLAFCKDVQARRIYIEDHAFGLASTSNANQTIEMTGVVKALLYTEWGIAPEPIHSAKARKILLQQLPRKDVKKFAQRNVKLLGGQVAEWTEDEIDAFVIANAGIMLAGGVAMTFLGK
jgi:hypothetical protein